jgi:hypothetical protein
VKFKSTNDKENVRSLSPRCSVENCDKGSTLNSSAADVQILPSAPTYSTLQHRCPDNLAGDHTNMQPGNAGQKDTMTATVEQTRRVDVLCRCVPQSGRKHWGEPARKPGPPKSRLLRKCDHETLVTQTSSSGALWILLPVIAGAIVLLPVTSCRRRNWSQAARGAVSKPRPHQEGETP